MYVDSKESRMPLTKSTLSLRATLALVLVISAGTAGATSMLVRSPNPIVPVEGSLSGSNDLTVDSQQLTYTGTEIDGLTVAVNNTAGTSHEGVVHIALRNSSGDLVAEQTTSTQTFSSNRVTNVSVTFANSHSVANVTRVEATVEQTG